MPLVLVLVLLALGGGFYFSYKNSPPTEEKKETTAENQVVSTSGWKIYADINHGFEFKFPSESGTLSTYAPPYDDWFSARIINPESNVSSISLHGERSYGSALPNIGESGVIYCHEGLCDRPSLSQVTYNDIVWDYLGATSYFDVGDTTVRPHVYRTFRNGWGFYFTFNSQEEAVEILSTFKFTK